MDTFIYTARNDIHVIDLQQTVELIKNATTLAKETEAKRRVYFICWNKQAQDAIASETERCRML